MGSANEVRCALRLVQAVEMARVDAVLLDRLDKVVATLWKLTH